MVPCSLRELPGLCSTTGFPLEIGLDPARQHSKLCPSGFPLKPTFFLCEMGVMNTVTVANTYEALTVCPTLLQVLVSDNYSG